MKKKVHEKIKYISRELTEEEKADVKKQVEYILKGRDKLVAQKRKKKF